MDRFVPSGCDILQYADDIVVYSSHHVLQNACAVFFFAAWTHDILYKVGGDIVLSETTCGHRSRSRLVADCCHKW
jgi:hypothetical protein